MIIDRLAGVYALARPRLKCALEWLVGGLPSVVLGAARNRGAARPASPISLASPPGCDRSVSIGSANRRGD